MSKCVYTRNVKEILNKTKYSEKIVILDRDKNLEFLFKYNYTEEEAVEIIRNLREKDFRYKYSNDDSSIDVDYLFVFHQDWQVPSYDGFCDINDIFIKVCYLNKNSKIIVGGSFHD